MLYRTHGIRHPRGGVNRSSSTAFGVVTGWELPY
jgi:hypothetical protein